MTKYGGINFFPSFLNSFHKFLQCVPKVKAFSIEITLCKSYIPSEKCPFLEYDK